MHEFVKMIEDDLMKDKDRTQSHVFALGLHNMSIVNELIQIHSGKVSELILKFDTPWNSGDDFSLIFELCKVNCRNVLHKQFAHEKICVHFYLLLFF